jgi:hypothetical protein
LIKSSVDLRRNTIVTSHILIHALELCGIARWFAITALLSSASVQSTKLSIFLRICLAELATAELHAFKQLFGAFAFVVGAARHARACEVVGVAFDWNF